MMLSGCRHHIPALLTLMVGLEVLGAVPPWTGAGSHRLLVRVDPVNIGARPSDQLVARCAVDFTALLGPGANVDLATLQVHKYDDATGQVEVFPPFESAISAYDRPCRFEDDAVPTAYPDRVGYASDYADGRPPITIRQRGGRLFNREMDNQAGHIVWTHTQNGNQSSYYAIYFDTLAPGDRTGTSPAPWIGDVDLHRLPTGQSLGGMAHFTVATGDLNGDGLFDLVAGVEKGDLMWFPNRGTPGNPVFKGCRMLTDTTGTIDMGWYAAPFLYDWDDDGRIDLIVGTSHNVIIWWKNIGTPTAPVFSYRGFVQAGGTRLQVPQSPVPEDVSGSFGVDYYNQPWVGDWNADGLPDILTGGYTTGRIYFFRCTGRDGAGVPILAPPVTVDADGAPIDTGWAASPTAFDFDGDGRLELLTGSWAFGGPVNPDNTLMYFRNLGIQAAPSYTRVAFPRTGNFPAEVIGRASVADWNNDGRQDLIFSANSGNVRVFLHDGTLASPHWRVDSPPLTIEWGFVHAIASMSAGNWDLSSPPELLSRSTVYGWEGSPHTPRTVVRGNAHVNGVPISQPGPGYGDFYNWTIFADWNKDTRVDILLGTQQGNVFYYENLGAPDNLTFAEGIKLTLTSGQDLKVGPPVYENPEDVPDFTALQGSRIIMAVADFDSDGIDDLAVTETYGNIWIFRNTVEGGTSTLAPGVLVRTGSQLPGLEVVDWNKDGRPDLLTSLSVTSPGTIFINQTTGSNFSFAAPITPLNLPFVFWGPILQVADWNGDGDDDFLIRSEFFYFWAERSFVDHGYRTAVVLGPVDSRTGSCCLDNGACLDGLTEGLCLQQEGVFGGIGSVCSETFCQSLCQQPFADADRDGDVDLSDYAAFQLCMTGADDPQKIFDADRCGCFDRGSDNPGDDDIDASDLAAFLACFNGPEQPPAEGCSH